MPWHGRNSGAVRLPASEHRRVDESETNVGGHDGVPGRCRRGPRPASATPAASRGELLYAMHCIACHGAQMAREEARRRLVEPAVSSESMAAVFPARLAQGGCRRRGTLPQSPLLPLSRRNGHGLSSFRSRQFAARLRLVPACPGLADTQSRASSGASKAPQRSHGIPARTSGRCRILAHGLRAAQ